MKTMLAAGAVLSAKTKDSEVNGYINTWQEDGVVCKKVVF